MHIHVVAINGNHFDIFKSRLDDFVLRQLFLAQKTDMIAITTHHHKDGVNHALMIGNHHIGCIELDFFIAMKTNGKQYRKHKLTQRMHQSIDPREGFFTLWFFAHAILHSHHDIAHHLRLCHFACIDDLRIFSRAQGIHLTVHVLLIAFDNVR